MTLQSRVVFIQSSRSNPEPLPGPQITYLVKDLYKEIIIGNPKRRVFPGPGKPCGSIRAVSSDLQVQQVLHCGRNQRDSAGGPGQNPP